MINKTISNVNSVNIFGRKKQKDGSSFRTYQFQVLLDSREFPQIDFPPQQVPFLICYTSSKMHLLTDCHQHRIFGIFDKKSR